MKICMKTDRELNSHPTSDAYAESEEVINTSENNHINNENVDETMNEPEQDSNMSSHGRPICIRRTAERRRSFVQHVNAQAKDKKKNILIDKRKIEKLFLCQRFL